MTLPTLSCAQATVAVPEKATRILLSMVLKVESCRRLAVAVAIPR
jgi:hypothetical protein